MTLDAVFDAGMTVPTNNFSPDNRKIWTEADEKALRQLWSEGFSASAIANRIGFSRNAVLGKRWRLNLPERRPDRTRDRETVTRDRKARRAASREREAKTKKERRQAYLRGGPLPFKQARSILPEPSAEFRCDVFALNQNTCRFPYGDGPFQFCGHQPLTSGPYCAYHADICRARA